MRPIPVSFDDKFCHSLRAGFPKAVPSLDWRSYLIDSNSPLPTLQDTKDSLLLAANLHCYLLQAGYSDEPGEHNPAANRVDKRWVFPD